MKKKPIDFTDEDVDLMIQLKFGQQVESQHHRAYMSNKAIANMFKCSATSIRNAYLSRFANAAGQRLSSSLAEEPMPVGRRTANRQKYGIRFLTSEHIGWVTNSDNLLA